MVSVLEGQLNSQLNFLTALHTSEEKTSFLFWMVLIITALKFFSMIKVLIMATVTICRRSYLEFQNVCSVLLPIDQRIIACQGLYALVDSGCVLAYFFLFESCCCFSIILSLHGPSRLIDAFTYEETFSLTGDDLSTGVLPMHLWLQSFIPSKVWQLIPRTPVGLVRFLSKQKTLNNILANNALFSVASIGVHNLNQDVKFLLKWSRVHRVS